MNAALRAMLEGVIDYAGVFPPAKLPLNAAVDEYLQIVGGRDQWIVDRFACPVGKLPDLLVELAEHPDDASIAVAVIASNHADHKHWKHGLEHDAAEMTRFEKAAENRAEIQAYEVRVPDHRHVEEYGNDLRSFRNVDLFVELPWSAEMGDSLALLAEMDIANAKARTGGAEAGEFPSSSELAGFIQQCVQLDLSFKLTAGLHHALPCVDSITGGRMHGFLNVLIATALALGHDLSRRDLEELLDDDNPRAFAFKGDSIVWKQHKTTLADAENARTLLCSIGSCSVGEPVEDLDRLGLLDSVSR